VESGDGHGAGTDVGTEAENGDGHGAGTEAEIRNGSEAGTEAEREMRHDLETPDESEEAWLNQLTPRQIVAELDKYIVGQDEAKKSVAIALRNRWRRQRVEEELRDEILPNNLILIGPTGVGKTEIARRLARLAGAPFVKVEASKYTEVGYVGRDVESMIRDLVDVAVNMVRAEREDDVEELADARTEERLLDLLLPTPASSPTVARPVPQEGGEGRPHVFVVGRESAEAKDVGGEADEAIEARRMRTREKLRTLLQDGKLEEREVEIEVSQTASIEGMVLPMGGGIEGMDHNFTAKIGRASCRERV
jgi:ATP-dependent HslUV protease ATP-binding subunit HslU